MLRFVLFIFSLTLAAAVPVLPATQASEPFSTTLPDTFNSATFLTASSDFVVATFGSGTNSSFAVYKRNNNGQYDVTATRYIKGQLQGLASISGNWIGLSFASLQQIYQLDASGNIENKYYNLTTTNNIQGGFMSDGAYVVVSQSGIRTYTFNETAGWTLNRTDLPANYDTFTKGNRFMLLDGCVVSVQAASGNPLLQTTLFLFRSLNMTWEYGTQFQFTVLQILFGAAYNLASQTLVVLLPQYQLARFLIYNKINNQWTCIQNFTADQFTTAQLGYTGAAMSFLDQDNLIVSAPSETTATNSIYGAVYWINRNATAGEWSPFVKAALNTTDQPGPGRSTVYGISPTPISPNNFVALQCTGANDITSTFDCSIATVDTCSLDPTNVTCHDVNIGSCNRFALNITDYYTINTPAQCGTVTARYTDFRSNTNKISVDLAFSRDLHDDVTCTVVLTCETAPIAAPGADAPVVINNATSLAVPALLSIGALLTWSLL